MQLGRVCALVNPRSLNAGQYLPRTTVNKRLRGAFHASKHLATIRPFLLSDIGEGGAAKSRILRSNSLMKDRYQGGTDYSMVRGTRSSCRAIRQDLRGPIG